METNLLLQGTLTSFSQSNPSSFGLSFPYALANLTYHSQAPIRFQCALSIRSLLHQSIDSATISPYFPNMWSKVSNNALLYLGSDHHLSHRSTSCRLAECLSYEMSMGLRRCRR